MTVRLVMSFWGRAAAVGPPASCEVALWDSMYGKRKLHWGICWSLNERQE